MFPHEKSADSIQHAREQSRTRYCWIVTYLADYSKWDWLWEPVPWQADQIHVWPSQWHQYSGTYLVPRDAREEKWNFHTEIIPNQSLRDNWKILHPIYEDRFDWSWAPHPLDPPYIYVFGNQHWPGERMPTVEYHVPGATERKYMDIQASLLPNRERWSVPAFVDPASVDYTWVPDPCDPPYIYVWGNQHWPGTIMPTVEYRVPGAVEIKYMDEPRPRLLPDRTHWEILEPIAQDEWDWTWVPNPKDPAYIYVWGNQWNPAEYKVSIRYVVPGATEIKYMEARTRRLPQPERFRFNLAVTDFDYSWEPNPFDPPMTYVFGNQWNPAVLEPTVVYDTGGTEIKYMVEPVATLAQDVSAWEFLDDIESFDYSWRPNPTDPPYNYVFGNQWLTPEMRPALMYRVAGAAEIKYMSEPRARRVSRPEDFVTHYNCDFDYSWEPDPGSPPYIYVFGNQHWPAEKMATVEYHVPGATERKFMPEPVAKLHPTEDHWRVTTDHEFEFDRSWCPDPGDPPYIYVFGNQWHPAEIMSTIEYHVPGATERKFLSEPQARILPNTERWMVPEEITAEAIDFSWIPDPGDPPYIYHFGSEYQASVGLTYTVEGATEIKFAGDIPVKSTEKKAVAVLDIFYMDRSNAMSAARFERLKEQYPHIVKVRYVNSVMDTIRRCVGKTKHNKFWVIGSENDYTDFDFAWHAQPWQSFMTHVFGSQWNKWSDTFLINKWEFERHAKWADGIEQFPNLNFVTDQQVTAPADACDIYVVDFGNAESQQTLEFLQGRYRVVKTARYFDNYLDTLKRLIKDVDAEHIWVVGSVCDYTRFDFSWQPEAWQRDMLHVFPSNEQKFGDTFYVPVKALRDKIDELELLDWFETVNYCDDQRVPRWPMPVITTDQDTHVDVALNSTFPGPVALFTNRRVDANKVPTVSLWREKTKTIVPLDPGAGAVVVPKNAISYIRTQMYDYPYIDRTYRNTLQDQPLDIVFISNGESNAEGNWLLLKDALRGCRNQIHRVDGVNGRVAAYQAAARASTTPWFFAVFAKLEVVAAFPWMEWMPDRMQQPKHYIFHARNPVNRLEYGHMAMIAYNRELVLANTAAPGLDFTLDQAHEVVPIVSGTAHYDSDPWMTWRTAFREVIKLRHSLPDVENEYRLEQWLNVGHGVNGHWSTQGARDALEYYDAVGGDFAELRKSYEWQWLATYALLKHNLLPNQ